MVFSLSSASLAKTQLPNHWLGLEEPRIRPELLSMSCDFRALAKMVEEELGSSGLGTPLTATASTNCSSLFERGRMYDEYSARRNERLKRKKGETEEERSVHDSGVPAVEFVKRRNAKKTESVRKSVPANFAIGRRDGLRSSVRISNESKKPVSSVIGEKSVVDGDKTKRTGVRTGRRN